MSDWPTLLSEFDRFDPSPSVPNQALGRALAHGGAEASQPAASAEPRNDARWTRRVVIALVAVAATAAVLLLLAIAAHSRTSAPAPANGPALPRCTTQDDRLRGLVQNGFVVYCGPASAEVQSAGQVHEIATGNCFGQWEYFGVETRRDVPHIGLRVHIPDAPRNPSPGGTLPMTGTIQMVPGQREQLSGTVTWTGTSVPDATFIARGRTSGQTYTGSWNCGLR